MQPLKKYSIKKVLKNQHKEIPGNPSTAKTSNVMLRKDATAESLRVLTYDQWRFWKENGYVVIKNAVERKEAIETAKFLWEFEEKDSKNPETWYAPPRATM